MTEEWERLVEGALSAPPDAAKKALEDVGRARGPEAGDLPTALARAVMENQSTDDWAGAVGYRSLVRGGIYSPVQLLLFSSAKTSGERVSHDYPFLFDAVSRLVSQLVVPRPKEAEPDAPPPSTPPVASPEEYCKVLQALFQLREMQEEGEPLSLEIHVPFESGAGATLPVKKLAQIFGRGVSLARGAGLAQRTDPVGGVQKIFPDHMEAPATLLYELRPTYQKISDDSVALILRRDRVTTIAKVGNPLVEFYDGGWHVVDLNSGQGLINLALDDHFDSRQNKDLAEIVLRLAYHMANHWHSGILAMVDVERLEAAKILEDQKPESIDVTTIIKDEVQRIDKRLTSLRITDVRQTKMGRVLLTNAIQDGAVLFKSDGEFHSAGRFVMSIQPDREVPRSGTDAGEPPSRESRPRVGSGNRAARQLAEFGVALKISRDGGIRVYSRPRAGGNHLELDGQRIR